MPVETFTTSIQQNCGFGSMHQRDPSSRRCSRQNLNFRYTRDLHDVEIDNQDDLDADLYTKSDFDEQIVQDTGGCESNFVLRY